LAGDLARTEHLRQVNGFADNFRRATAANERAVACWKRIACLVFLLVVAFAAKPARAVPIGGVDTVVKRLKTSTTVPVLLPTNFPASLTATAVYVIFKSASHGAYAVQLVSGRRCNGERTCLLGTAAGQATKPPSPLGAPLKFARGVKAYYDAPTLTWKQGRAWYQLSIPGTTAYSLRMAALSMRSY
jgi:hypothetical protein